MATDRRYDELDGQAADELLDDHVVEQLLAGRLGEGWSDLRDLSVFVTAIRSVPTAVPPVVRPELAAIFETEPAPGNGALSPVAADQPIRHTSRRRRMLEALSGFVATLTGKVVLATAAVAVSVGAANAAGVVDVPHQPEPASDVPAVNTPDQTDHRAEPETGRPDDPGVDGSSISKRATSGEPQEDGRSFGASVADEATDGTPAEDRPGNDGGAAADQQSEAPTGGAEAAEQHRPESSGDADAADESRPSGDADTADQSGPAGVSTGRP
jgi:hypothetical protein